MAAPKANALAQCAMAIKTHGGEPTYAHVVAAVPVASVKPDMDRPFEKKRVYQVFREKRFDEVPQQAVVVGSVIVVGAGLYVIYRERRLGLDRAEQAVTTPARG